MKTIIDVLKMTDDKVDKAVKIQGTKYDRKRKFSDYKVRKMRKMAKDGYEVCEIAKALGLNWTAVKYIVDKDWKSEYNWNRYGKHSGRDMITAKNRVAYKRELVASGKVSV